MFFLQWQIYTLQKVDEKFGCVNATCGPVSKIFLLIENAEFMKQGFIHLQISHDGTVTNAKVAESNLTKEDTFHGDPQRIDTWRKEYFTSHNTKRKEGSEQALSPKVSVFKIGLFT
jgi:hypothetical protein